MTVVMATPLVYQGVATAPLGLGIPSDFEPVSGFPGDGVDSEVIKPEFNLASVNELIKRERQFKGSDSEDNEGNFLTPAELLRIMLYYFEHREMMRPNYRTAKGGGRGPLMG